VAHDALLQARQRQQTAAFKAVYAQRAGVEGTMSQAAAARGMRRSRYIGLAKTNLQHLLTAAAINLTRVVAWWWEKPRAKTVLSETAPTCSWQQQSVDNRSEEEWEDAVSTL